ncbi:MAG: hypothetical protein HY609_05705 [Deltaproteobacteria bacterium]|nr:hypothetical protein [Deltaproteobacteria bacterium]
MKINFGDPQFDLRTLPRALSEKRISQKDVDDYLKKLPDEAKQAEEIKLGEAKPLPKPKKQKPASKEPTFAPANEVEVA